MLAVGVDEEVICCGRILCCGGTPPLDNVVVAFCLPFSTLTADKVFWTIVLIAFCLAPKLNIDEDNMSSTLILAALAKLLVPLLLVFLLSVLSAGLAGKVTRDMPLPLRPTAMLGDLLDEWVGVLATDRLHLSVVGAGRLLLLIVSAAAAVAAVPSPPTAVASCSSASAMVFGRRKSRYDARLRLLFQHGAPTRENSLH